jgi:putative ABC transport system ATP-binding protein
VSARGGVELNEVAKRYETPAGVVRAVERVSLDVQPGTSIAITGPSGCGKSTLLGLIGGLDAPTEGHVRIGGRQISTLPEVDRDRLRRHEIGFVFQSDNLLPFLTATENVSVQCSLNGIDDGNARSIELLAQLGLAEEADRFPDQLSGGQRQRVAVARALVHRPSLIVADEPTGSLDKDASQNVADILVELNRNEQVALIVVTHSLELAQRVGRVMELNDGVLTDRK